ncbi:hypothetical protein [Pedobacter caeni]|uniref:YD repeat-containing protein n=1 Tax=Pedobacter caeni TaxID=288992 RepID=A0A1M5B6D2_9SPHI|nr:hypothetical protein [Pedobacter caeni]SHF38000.1 hypothetical protein SAMN04488522_1021043 [Pedobacter caeni]
MKRFASVLLLLAFTIISSCVQDNKKGQQAKNNCQLSEVTFSKPGTKYAAGKVKAHFTYDVQGRISKVSVDSTYVLNYTYSLARITEEKTYLGNAPIQTFYELDNKQRIISRTSPKYAPGVTMSYVYDSEGYLVQTKMTSTRHKEVYTSRFIYKNGNVTRIIRDDLFGYAELFFGYGTTLCPDNFIAMEVVNFPEEFTQPLKNYFGKGLKNLIVKATISGITSAYIYYKDAQGNVIQFTDSTLPEQAPTVLSDLKYNCN